MKHRTRKGVICLLAWAALVLLPAATRAGETRVDGFGRLISTRGRGNYFLTHRGPRTDMAYVRTTADRFPLIWETPPVPAQAGDRVVFAWDTVMSGLHHRSGAFLDREGKMLVELSVNDKLVMTFPIAVKGDTRTVAGQADDPNRIELFFDYLAPDAVGNLNGISYLSLPASMAPPGKPVTLKVQPKPADRIAFYAVGCTSGVWAFAATVAGSPAETSMSAELAALHKKPPPFAPTNASAPASVADAAAALPDPQSKMRVAIVSGLTGGAEDAAIIDGAVKQADRLFRETLRYPADHVRVLADKASPGPDKRADSSRETIGALFRELQTTLRPDDALLLMLIGNANKVDDRVMFNVRGPDMRPEDFSALLDSLPCRLVVVCVFTPVSGAFLKALSLRGRVIIAACGEDQIYRTSFAEPFLRALAAPEADKDSNGRVSLLEAFDSANQAVGALYARTGYLRTEQALLDDSGDGAGSAAPGPFEANGALAARLFLKSAR